MKKRLFKLLIVLLGIMMYFGFSKVQASEITSIFTGEKLNRENIQKLETFQSLSNELITVERVESGYQYNNGSNDIWEFRNKSNPADKYYCLNKDQGFQESTAQYNYQIELNMNNLNQYSTKKWTQERYNQLLWVLDNIYIPDSSQTDIYKDQAFIALLEKVGLPTQRYGSNQVYDLTVDDVLTAQRLAIWHFTNNLDVMGSITGAPDQDLENQLTGEIRALSRKKKMVKIYDYFVQHASTSYKREEPTLTIDQTKATIQESEGNYVFGPYVLKGNNTNQIISVTQKSNGITFKLLDESKDEVDNNNFSKVIGKDFYISVAKSQITQSSTLQITLTYHYQYRKLTLLTNTNDWTKTQPLVKIEKVETEKSIALNTSIDLIDVEVEKKWEDDHNQDNVRPTSVKVQLYADGEAYGESIELNDQNSWKHTWTKLLKGKEYTVRELNASNHKVENNQAYDNHYTASYVATGNKTTITNTHKPELVEKTVTKIWEDGGNSDAIRPSSIEVQLYKTVKGVKTSMEEDYRVTLDESNHWTYTWTNLPAREAGEVITYTVEETVVPTGYDVSYSSDTFTITNTHVPKNLAIQLQKVDEEGEIITSSETTFEITGTEELTSQTTGGMIELESQKIVGNTFEFTYRIKETVPPMGYEEQTEELTLKITGTAKVENGSYVIEKVEFTDADGKELDQSKISAEYDKEHNKVVIQIVNKRKTNQYTVKLLKVGEDGSTPLAGAWFKIDDNEQAIPIPQEGEEIGTGILKEKGTIDLVYQLQETIAPEGYLAQTGIAEVKIRVTVDLIDNEYEITNVELIDSIEGITVSEENNVIIIKVKNEAEITGKYSVALRKVDQDGNILNGATFEIDGTKYTLPSGEVTIVKDKDLTSDKDLEFTYAIKETTVPEGYEGIEDKTIYIRAKVQTEGNNYQLIRVEFVDSTGKVITDENISVKLEGDTIVIVVKNTPIKKQFDLALRKFITKVNDESVAREPVVDTSTISTKGTATYQHSKQPIVVQKGDIVTYTMRVYNEGELDGYVDQITDYLPTNLKPIIEGVEGIDAEKYAEEIDFNSNWLWQISPEDENAVITTITSKSNSETYAVLTGLEQVTDTKLDAYVEGSDQLDYIDVQIKCLVSEKVVTDEYLTNIAEITNSQDINGVQGDGNDSQLDNVDASNLSDYKNEEANQSTTQSYIPGQEDDDDFEKLLVKEFDLALRKFITKVNEESYSREPVVDASGLGKTGSDGKVVTDAIYQHSKEPVIVETGDIITYTIRVYNEGTLDGYANEITDDLPNGLAFLPDSSVNVAYGWKMLDSEGNETTDVTKAVKITTDYLSEENVNHIIKAVSETEEGKVLSYQDVEVQFRVIATAQKGENNVIRNVAQISGDSDRDIDSNPSRDEVYQDNGNNEDDIDYEPVVTQYFDLALRKFITKVNSTDYNNRYPEVVFGEEGEIKYNHTKDPVIVAVGDTVVYTIRVYNEGEKAGYAEEITDDLPEGLVFLPDNEINQQYGWKLMDQQGNETKDLTQAVKVTTDYLKNQLIDGLVVENGQRILSYQDVQIAFKVEESNDLDRILVNIAEISKDSDDDIDSTPDNHEPTEDDEDREYVKVEYFDLSLKKWVTEVRVTYNGKTTVTKTGFTEDSQEMAKVDLVASRMKKTTVKFVYKIKVTNEGETAGYAKEIKDYIPKGLEFVAADNKGWTEQKDGQVVTDQLKDTLLNPGESATVEIVLRWKNSTTNMGVKTNYAEISDDSGDDIDSTPNNFNKQEDDIDDAQVILSIKTAGAKTYIVLVFTSIAILAGGIFFIKKYVIN